MKAIAHLIARSLKSDIFQGTTGGPRVYPIAKYPLVGFPELSRSGKHSTSVDPHWKIEGHGIFQGDQF